MGRLSGATDAQPVQALQRLAVQGLDPAARQADRQGRQPAFDDE